MEKNQGEVFFVLVDKNSGTFHCERMYPVGRTRFWEIMA